MLGTYLTLHKTEVCGFLYASYETGNLTLKSCEEGGRHMKVLTLTLLSHVHTATDTHVQTLIYACACTLTHTRLHSLTYTPLCSQSYTHILSQAHDRAQVQTQSHTSP